MTTKSKLNLTKVNQISDIVMELVIGKKDGSIDNASIPIRWCLTKQLLNKINDSKYDNPQILIQVEYQQKSLQVSTGEKWYTVAEERHLFPLNQFIAYIPLSQAGRVNINAYLVGKTEGEFKCYSRAFLSRDSYGTYNKTHIESKSEVSVSSNIIDHETITIDIIASALDYIINIPEAIFGKKPPKWLWNLLNRYQDDRVVDQCQLRRRYIFFPLKLILISLEFFMRMLGTTFIYIVLHIVGFTKVPTEVFKHPLTYWWNYYIGQDLIHVIDIYIKPTEGSLKRNLLYGFLLFYRIPLIPILTTLGLWIGLKLTLSTISPSIIFLLILGPAIIYLMIGIIACIICGCIITYRFISRFAYKIGFMNSTKWLDIIFTPFNYIFNQIDRYIIWLEDRDNKKAKLKLMKYEKYLTCNNDPHSVTAEVDLIPILDRTPTLIYTNIKNKVCKPLMR